MSSNSNLPKWAQGTWAIGVGFVIVCLLIGGCAVMWGSDPVTKETKPGAKTVANVTFGGALVMCICLLITIAIAEHMKPKI